MQNDATHLSFEDSITQVSFEKLLLLGMMSYLIDFSV